jgi:hypothetical protein
MEFVSKLVVRIFKDHAAELEYRAVAGALDNPAVVDGDGQVDHVVAHPGDRCTRQTPVLVGGEPKRRNVGGS